MLASIRVSVAFGGLISIGPLMVTGCKSGTCNESSACPVVDQGPIAGDVSYEFAAGELVNFEYAGKPSVQILTGGQVVASPFSCADFNNCTITLKRLTFLLSTIEVDYSNGNTTAEDTAVTFETPLTLTGSILLTDGFFLPAGTVVHTCANVNGLPWHASAPLTGDQIRMHSRSGPRGKAGAVHSSTAPFLSCSVPMTRPARGLHSTRLSLRPVPSPKVMMQV